LLNPISWISKSVLQKYEKDFEVKFRNKKEGLNIYGFPENINCAENAIRSYLSDFQKAGNPENSS